MGEWCLNFELDLRNFIVDKLPDDGTLVPKHVGADTGYEVCFMVCFIVFYSVQFFWFLKTLNAFYIYFCLAYHFLAVFGFVLVSLLL